MVRRTVIGVAGCQTADSFQLQKP